MKKLMIIGLIGLVTILVISPMDLGEVQSEVSVIKMLPADWNPYQRLYDEMLYPTVRVESVSGIGSGVIIHHKGSAKPPATKGSPVRVRTKDTKNIYIDGGSCGGELFKCYCYILHTPESPLI